MFINFSHSITSRCCSLWQFMVMCFKKQVCFCSITRLHTIYIWNNTFTFSSYSRQQIVISHSHDTRNFGHLIKFLLCNWETLKIGGKENSAYLWINCLKIMHNSIEITQFYSYIQNIYCNISYLKNALLVIKWSHTTFFSIIIFWKGIQVIWYSFRHLRIFLCSHSMWIPDSMPEDVHFLLYYGNKYKCQ